MGSACLVSLFTLVVGYFFYFLHHFAYLPGTDAYYYALQTQSLLDSGHLKVPDGGLLYFVIAGASRFGFSIETSFELVLVAIYALYNLGLLLSVLRLRSKVQPLAAFLWIFSSTVIVFHTIEFPELSVGLALVPIWFWLVSAGFKGRLIWLTALLSMSALMHPAVAGVVLLFVFTFALGGITARNTAARRIPFKRSIFGLLILAAVLIGAAAKWPGIVVRLNSLAPGPPALFGFVAAPGVPGDMKCEALFFWVVLTLMFFANMRNQLGRFRYFLPAILALPLWPTHDASLFGLGGRLIGIFVFLVPPLIVQVLHDVGETSKLFSWMQSTRSVATVAILLVGAIATLPVRLADYAGLLVSNDYPQFERIVLFLSREEIPMLIAHRGLDFYYSYRLRRDAFHFDPEPNWNRSEVWRVAIRITPEEFAYYAPLSCAWGEAAKWIDGTDYLLVREDCWESLRARLMPNDNPDLYTEVWEDMENPSQPRPAFLRARHRGLVERAFPAFTGGGK